MEYTQNMKVMNTTMIQVAVRKSLGNIVSFPEQITLMPLQACNYKCIMCNEWKAEKKPELSMDVLEKIRPVLPFVSTLFITGGEPLMYRHIGDLFSMGREAGCDLWMVTNGALLDEKRRQLVVDSGLSRVKISLDAATPETYQSIRGGDFNKVLVNILKLNKLKIQRGVRNPEIQLGFVAMRRNIGELPNLVAMAGELGVNSIYVSYMGAQNLESVPESLYFHQDLSDQQMLAANRVARQNGVKLELPPLFSQEKQDQDYADRRRSLCYEPWRNLFIRPDGRCNLCCGGGGGCGGLSEMSFTEMWNHPARINAREKVNSEQPPAACVSCKTVKQTPSDLGTHFNTKALREAAQEHLKNMQADSEEVS